jgi:hypothetical protein
MAKVAETHPVTRQLAQPVFKNVTLLTFVCHLFGLELERGERKSLYQEVIFSPATCLTPTARFNAPKRAASF